MEFDVTAKHNQVIGSDVCGKRFSMKLANASSQRT
jgi:hypothetical protein